MLVGLVDGLGGEMELRGFTVANFFENPEFLDHSELDHTADETAQLAPSSDTDTVP